MERGKLTADQRARPAGRLTGTTELEDLAACDLVIEAATENVAVKRETFARLDEPAAFYGTKRGVRLVASLPCG